MEIQNSKLKKREAFIGLLNEIRVCVDNLKPINSNNSKASRSKISKNKKFRMKSQEEMRISRIDAKISEIKSKIIKSKKTSIRLNKNIKIKENIIEIHEGFEIKNNESTLKASFYFYC